MHEKLKMRCVTQEMFLKVACYSVLGDHIGKTVQLDYKEADIRSSSDVT